MTNAAPRVAMDVTLARFDQAGSGTYAARLSEQLQRLLGPRFVPLSFRFAKPWDARRTVTDKARTLLRDLGWSQYLVLRAARRSGAALLHIPAATGPIRGKVPLVVTIHDLAALRFPERFRPWFRNYSRVVTPRLARRAAAVIAVSRASQADVVERLGVPEDRVHVVHNGVDPAFRPRDPHGAEAAAIRARYGLPERFALTVGSIEPRKNLGRILEAVARLRRRPETRDLVLIHAGPPGWLADDARRRAAAPELAGAVRLLGYVPPEDLPVLYALASLTVYPSLFEGFGLPVVEAMAAGSPVVTSNVSSLPEVAGAAALLVDPLDTDAIADAMARLWCDHELRATLRERGLKRAAQFTWSRAARETIAVYERVFLEAVGSRR